MRAVSYLFLGLCALCFEARADTPTGSASASATAEAPRPLADLPPPADETPVPSMAEWKTAQPVLLERPLPEDCSARLVREWLRLRCLSGGVPGSGSVVGGSSKGVAFFMWIAEQRFDTRTEPSFIEVLMPLRRGDARMIQLTRGTGSDYGGLFGQDLVMLVSEQWLDGDPAPIVTVTPQPFSDGAIHGLRWGSAEEAKKLDFHAPWAGFYALEVDPDSPAAASGVKPGDHLTFEDDMNAFQQRYAFEAGSKFSYTVMRKGGSMRTLDLPRGRYDEEAWKPKK